MGLRLVMTELDLEEIRIWLPLENGKLVVKVYLYLVTWNEMPFGGKTLADQVAAMIGHHVRNEDLDGSGYDREVEENKRLSSFKFQLKASTGDPQKNFVFCSQGVHENQMEILGYWIAE